MISADEIEAKIKQTTDEKAKVDLLNSYALELRNISPKQSLIYAEEALSISETINYIKGKADSYSHIGFTNIHDSKHEKAFSILLDSLALYEQINDETGIANAQYNLGVLQLRIGVFDQALKFLHNSLSIRQRLNDKSGMAACYFQLTYLSQHFNDLDSAYENAIKSMELRKETNDSTGLAASLMVLGEVYLKRKDFVKAKEILQQSLELRRASNEKMGYFATLLRWSELHLELNEFDKAKEFANEGLQISTEENMRFGVMRFMQMLGKIEMSVHNLAGAKEKYEEALSYAEKYSFNSVQYEVYESLSEIYKQENDFKKALECFEKFHSKKEEVISMQTNTQLKTVQFMGQIEFARKEAEIEKVKNTELQKAYSIIEEKNKDITDSINYAKRIQLGILPSEKEMQECLKNYFVFYKPKDIVSGDFYWCVKTTDKLNNKLSLIAAIDCTGHGVPGAFMSILAHSLLNQTINNPDIDSPSKLLDFLNRELPKNLKSQDLETSIKDGMDMSLCVINFETRKLYFAGANNPLWIIRKGEFIEIKADKQAISASDEPDKELFTTHSFDLQKDDCIYIFTDGFADQFGGVKGKKFMYKQLKESLINVCNFDLSEQKTFLEKIFNDWKGSLEQVDDVCLIGIKIN